MQVGGQPRKSLFVVLDFGVGVVSFVDENGPDSESVLLGDARQIDGPSTSWR